MSTKEIGYLHDFPFRLHRTNYAISRASCARAKVLVKAVKTLGEFFNPSVIGFVKV